VFNVNVFQLLEVPNFQEAWVTAGAQARGFAFRRSARIHTVKMEALDCA
jgi:hypothetical protein